jgi:hypothetical protein
VNNVVEERKMRLLAAGEAEVTPLGLRFMGKRYVCRMALRDNWYARAAGGCWQVPVWIEPREQALYIEDGDEFEQCLEAGGVTGQIPDEQRESYYETFGKLKDSYREAKLSSKITRRK